MSPKDPMAFDDLALLDVWERSAGIGRPWGEIALLAEASGAAAEQLATLTVGERDRLILRLRQQLLGDRFDCETRCPACDEHLELTLDARQLLLPHPLPTDAEIRLGGDDYLATCRLPNSADLAACNDQPHPADALLALCVHVVDGDGAVIDARQLPMSMRERLDAHIAALDPQAEVLLDLRCPGCGHGWQAPFDPAAFLLLEIDAYAVQLLDDVHQLALAYGWSERDILAMRPSRRRRYLERVLQ
jgi:hypothetical protein